MELFARALESIGVAVAPRRGALSHAGHVDIIFLVLEVVTVVIDAEFVELRLNLLCGGSVSDALGRDFRVTVRDL